MKKLLYVLLVFAMVLTAFSGCGSKDANRAQIANPVHECSEEELSEATGISLSAPEGAENVKYAYIDAEDKVAQVEFTLDGNSYCYRAKTTSEIIEMDLSDENLGIDEAADILEKAFEVSGELSGYYEKWNLNGNGDVSYCPAIWLAKEKGAAVITWFDKVPGILYTLSTDKYTSFDVLVETANACFVPAQGEVG